MLRKSWLIYALLLVFCSILYIPDKAYADPTPLDSISAESYVLMDADSGKVLKSKNAHRQLAPASMTKLMTMLLALEAIEHNKAHKTDKITASQYAASMEGTRIYLEPGEVMSMDDMLKAMALASANDASVAVAEKLGGSEAGFVEQMNQKAASIGMKDSSFKNVSGLTAPGHYSSAYDMAILARYTLAHTPIIEYSSIKQYNLRQGTFPIYNGNKLLWRYEGADGLKNGYTSEAKNCLTATAKRGKLRLIVVVMGCPFKGGQTNDAMNLLDYGFDHHSSLKLLAPNEVCASIKVKGGTAKEVKVLVPTEVNAIYQKSQGAFFTRRQDVPDSIEAPVKRGQKLGEMQILNNGKLLKKVDLIAANDVPQITWGERMMRIPWIIKILILFILAIYYIRWRLRRNGGKWNRPKFPARTYNSYR